jgi:hypothetical protein
MQRAEFKTLLKTEIERLFQEARKKDELLRLKHRGLEAPIPFEVITDLVGKSVDFFYGFMTVQMKALHSFLYGAADAVTAHPGAESGARMDWPARVSRMA